MPGTIIAAAQRLADVLERENRALKSMDLPQAATFLHEKTAAIAAPYDSGAAVTIMLRTKVDILTISFHDPDGALHGAIFALPIGQAEQMRAQLIQAGAHAGAGEK